MEMREDFRLTLNIASAKKGFEFAGWSTSVDGMEYRIGDIVVPLTT